MGLTSFAYRYCTKIAPCTCSLHETNLVGVQEVYKNLQKSGSKIFSCALFGEYLWALTKF